MLFMNTSRATQHCSDIALHSLFRTGWRAFWLASCITSFFFMHLTCWVIRQHFVSSQRVCSFCQVIFYDTYFIDVYERPTHFCRILWILSAAIYQAAKLSAFILPMQSVKIPRSFSTWHSVVLGHIINLTWHQSWESKLFIIKKQPCLYTLRLLEHMLKENMKLRHSFHLPKCNLVLFNLTWHYKS